MAKMKFEDWVLGLVATALAVIAMGVFVKLTWKVWDILIQWLINLGYRPEIEYVIGLLLFIAACVLGIIQLKKFKKKIRLPI